MFNEAFQIQLCTAKFVYGDESVSWTNIVDNTSIINDDNIRGGVLEVHYTC